MPSTLLAVKFHIPKTRPVLIERPYLLERFTTGLAGPITLISAPAGFGKSTLLSAWHERQAAGSDPAAQSYVFCWLSLETADNDTVRFWTYLVAAIQSGVKQQPGEGAAALSLRLTQLLEILQSNPPPLNSVVQDELINAICVSSERIILVLDDYHVIQAADIHEQVTYLIDHQPPNLHLVILTRADPPLPIARLRARGQLSEFRTADLRFTVEETVRFFKTMTGIAMDSDEVIAIQASTEGWIAGLQMAALALQAVMNEETSGRAPADSTEAQQGKIKEFVGGFSGKQLYILDYLTDEVFNRQPAAVREFLLKTSILDRMSAGLCAAMQHGCMPGGEAGEVSESDARAQAKGILDYLEKSNLFLVRLDQERQWFRYHHLFADLLRARLAQTWPELIPVLHRSASHWYAQNGCSDDAVQHALAAKDWGWAARLMEMNVSAYLELGQLAIVLKWIDELPNDVLRGRPILCLEVAWALTHAGEFQRVPPLMDAVEAALITWDEQREGSESLFPTGEDLLRVRGILALLRGFGSILSGNPEQALQQANHALETISGLAPKERAWLYWICGYAYRNMGLLDQSIHFHEIALDIGQKANLMWEDFATELGIVYRFRGKLAQAADIFQKVLRNAEEQGLRKKGSLSRVEACLCAVLFDQNHLEEALQHGQKGVQYLQWWPSHNHSTTAYSYMGQVLLGMGRLEDAAEALERARQEQFKGQVLPTVQRLVERVTIQFWVQCEDWDSLEQWLSAEGMGLPVPPSETRLFDEYEGLHLLSLARAWIAKGRKEGLPRWFEQAFQLLSQLEVPAKRSNWSHALIEINLLQAVALHEMAQHGVRGNGNALDNLTQSLQLGLPEGYLRVYLQEGAVVAEMLQSWLRSPGRQPNSTGLSPHLVNGLLGLFRLDQIEETGKARGNLVEPLTEREQEVLNLLALGLSNKEMAERMVVSEGTVKTHVHNVIGKLGAQSRIHALARAKELGLL